MIKRTKSENSSKKSVLIVDDNKMDRNILEYYMNQYGHSSTTCSSAFEAMDEVFENKYDLILIDIRMPQFNGLQLQKRIHKYCEMKDIPIVLMSADQVDPMTIITGVKNGARDFLVKPVSFATLKKKIDEIYKKKCKPIEPRVTKSSNF